MSHTFNRSNLGIVTTGSWIGEESCVLRGEIPQVYTAVAVGEVKAFALHCDDFMNKFPSEAKVQVKQAVYTKLFKLRDKMQSQNQLKKTMEQMDLKTAHLAHTINHMNTIYPVSNLAFKKRMNKEYAEKTNNNPFKILTLMNGGAEKLREEIEQRHMQGNADKKPSFKSEIHNR